MIWAATPYVTKPMEFERFGETIRSIGRFLSVITIPAESPNAA